MQQLLIPLLAGLFSGGNNQHQQTQTEEKTDYTPYIVVGVFFIIALITVLIVAVV